MSAPAPTTLPFQPGDLVADKYRIERVLAQGGMGVVVAAHHEALGQRVAIKVLLPEVAGSGPAVARFTREAQAAARIQSPHVCRVFDVGTLPNGAPYMVMELLEGADLAAEIGRRGKLPPAEVAGYVLEALDAIVEAHRRGIIHRDLKPANLFLCRRDDGRVSVKVLDFGISKIEPREHSGPSFQLTSTQTLLGSPAYMSPEQVRSTKDVDARTDIWALGVILHEAIAGGPLFGGETLGEVFSKIREDPIPALSTLVTDVPSELERIVTRCLQRKPDERFASAVELHDALAAYLASSSSSGAIAGPLAARAPRPSGTAAAQTAAAADTIGAETLPQTEVAAAPAARRSGRGALVVAAIALVGGAAGVFALLGRGAGERAPAIGETVRTSEALPTVTVSVTPAATSSEPSVSAGPVLLAPPVASSAASPSASAPPPASATAPRVPPRATGTRPAAPSVDELLGKRR